MSTRSVIAEPTEIAGKPSWRGTYHHWDGYPEGMGPTLHGAWGKFFDHDVEAMRQRLIRDEPVGWSSIHGYNLSLPSCYISTSDDEAIRSFAESIGVAWEDVSRVADYVDPPERRADYSKVTTLLHPHMGPQSFSARGDTDPLTIDPTTGDCGTEWCYVLTDAGITVYERRYTDGPHMTGMFGIGAENEVAGWLHCGDVDWNDPDPDWSRVECGKNLERCEHYAWYHFPEAEGTEFNTRQWLGLDPPDPIKDATHVRIDGKIYQMGHSGGVRYEGRPYVELYPHERDMAKDWWGSIKARNGRTIDRHLWSHDGEGGKIPAPGVEFILPEIPNRQELV